MGYKKLEPLEYRGSRSGEVYLKLQPRSLFQVINLSSPENI